MKMARGVGSIVGVAVLTTAAAFAAAGPAAAGSNGQHVKACGSAFSATIWGTDQNGHFAQAPITLVKNGCAEFGTLWLKGAVTVRWYSNRGSYSESQFNIPVSWPQDWYSVYK
ncbi:hypothetical protein ACIA49_33535 [Kribbella sp. NPDC051587]|uniref:hypothetical protein n=1 Tax=Kribbella sp. NPDC051587 TaxID=3364119 RepID=UPI0037ADFBD4